MSQKSLYLFRGIKLELSDTLALNEVPTELFGESPEMYALDRWKPVDMISKIMTKELPERSKEWVRTQTDSVIYGLERWGEIIPNNYQEWFAVMVIRPKLFTPQQALKTAETGMWREAKSE